MEKRGNRWAMFGGPMDMVLPSLFLGGAAAEERYDELKRKGITHVLQVGNELCPSYPEQFTYLTHSVHDHPRVQLSSFFPRAFSFIDEGIASGGVLVDCVMGASRSATICVGYIMWKRQMTLDKALKMVQAVRPRVQPNPGFMDQLLAFQEQEWRLLSEEGEHMKQDGGTASAQQATSCALLPV